MAKSSLSMRQRICEYFPGCTLGRDDRDDHGVQKVVLQLFGLLGHGKSSLINTCLCVINGGRYKNRAPSAEKFGGVTMERMDYDLTSRVVMIDTRGLNKLTVAETLETSAQFRYLRELEKVTWTGISTREASRLCDEEQRTRPAHLLVPVFVHSCNLTWSETEREEIKAILLEVYRITGIHPIIVITNLSFGRTKDLREQFKKFGSPHIFAVENYTEDNHKPKLETEHEIEEFLHTCLMEAESRIQKMEGEDLSERVVRQATNQIKEEGKVLKQSVDRLESLLKM